ncbi:MAG: methyltransferase domain-containing protein [Candidatus Gorgyraea atricola]|nr:methyltransferase domain-containing protein [Candidatus Gorgyraea atricola]
MDLKGWDKMEIKKTEELPSNAWTLGYYHSSHENWDGKTWVRNLHELKIRDLALFVLGDVRCKKILDIGCGPGIYMLTIAKMGGKVSGQDISSDYVNKSSILLKENGFDADVKAGDAVKLLFEDNYFDGVFSADFFEHINYEQKNQVISEVYRVLKPGGTFTIKTPNLDYLRLSVFLKRCMAVFRLRSPFRIYIPHTHNNPNNEHHGLTTYAELSNILFDHMFHSPKVVNIPLKRKGLSKWVTNFLFGKKRFNEQIIVTTRKPLFYGFYSG